MRKNLEMNLELNQKKMILLWIWLGDQQVSHLTIRQGMRLQIR